MRFRPAIFIRFDSYLLNLSSNFRKMMTFESFVPCLSDCETMISVDYIMNALKHCKVRLPFFIHPAYRRYTCLALSNNHVNFTLQ